MSKKNLTTKGVASLYYHIYETIKSYPSYMHLISVFVKDIKHARLDDIAYILHQLFINRDDKEGRFKFWACIKNRYLSEDRLYNALFELKEDPWQIEEEDKLDLESGFGGRLIASPGSKDSVDEIRRAIKSKKYTVSKGGVPKYYLMSMLFFQDENKCDFIKIVCEHYNDDWERIAVFFDIVLVIIDKTDNMSLEIFNEGPDKLYHFVKLPKELYAIFTINSKTDNKKGNKGTEEESQEDSVEESSDAQESETEEHSDKQQSDSDKGESSDSEGDDGGGKGGRNERDTGSQQSIPDEEDSENGSSGEEGGDKNESGSDEDIPDDKYKHAIPIVKLTEEERKTIHDRIDEGRDNITVCVRFERDITKGALRRLFKDDYLNDEVVNAYCQMCIRRISNGNDIDFIDSQDKKYKRVGNTKRFVFIVRNVNNIHWILICVDTLFEQIITFDSLRYVIEKEVDALKKAYGNKYDIILRDKSIPQQKDGYNCGVFVCMYCNILTLYLSEYTDKKIPLNIFKVIDKMDAGRMRSQIQLDILRDAVYPDKAMEENEAVITFKAEDTIIIRHGGDEQETTIKSIVHQGAEWIITLMDDTKIAPEDTFRKKFTIDFMTLQRRLDKGDTFIVGKHDPNEIKEQYIFQKGTEVKYKLENESEGESIISNLGSNHHIELENGDVIQGYAYMIGLAGNDKSFMKSAEHTRRGSEFVPTHSPEERERVLKNTSGKRKIITKIGNDLSVDDIKIYQDGGKCIPVFKVKETIALPPWTAVPKKIDGALWCTFIDEPGNNPELTVYITNVVKDDTNNGNNLEYIKFTHTILYAGKVTYQLNKSELSDMSKDMIDSGIKNNDPENVKVCKYLKTTFDSL